MERINLGSVPVDPVTHAGALDAIERLVTSGTGGFVVTPNVDHIVLAERDVALRRTYHRSSLSLADGQPLTWMARLLGTPIPARVSGSDIIEPLIAHAAERGWRVFFFGATDAVSTAAAHRLMERHPGLRIVGRDTSRWSPDVVDPPGGSPVVRAIQATRADLVIVAMGCPKQEFWMAKHSTEIAPAVALGLGGSLDFVAGAVPRAPAWVSAAGLEWCYRLAREPRRLAYRYLVRDAGIVPIIVRAWWRAARQQRRPVAGATD